MTQNHLIIFVKNPVAGQVKARIARIVGDDLAITTDHLRLAFDAL